MTHLINKKHIRITIFIFMSIFLITIDQFTKYFAQNILAKYETIPIISSILHFTYVKNYGAAFGIFENNKFFLLLPPCIIFICTFFLIIFIKQMNRIKLYSIILIFSGGVGNFIDRIFTGYVIDYIDFRLIQFPVFNFADICICIGTFIILVYTIFFESTPIKEK